MVNKATKRVLVVDDEAEVTLSLQMYFGGKGYEILTALEGGQAIRLLDQNRIDLVLLDMKMPGVNGLEVLKHIRSLDPIPKVIVVTAYDVQFQEMVEAMGVDGFLMKPFGIQALTHKVEDALEGRPEARPMRPAAAAVESVPASARAPKARLLFVEPSEYTYKLKEIFFNDSEKCGGKYEVASAYSMEEALKMLDKFRPDILLADFSVLGKVSDMAGKVMASASKPKELIMHGSGSAVLPNQNQMMGDLTRMGVKVVQNESFTRAGLVRLGDVIRKTALQHGLTAPAAS
jgi:two-component system response regulator (stage 0 sporulation protein F)